MPKACTLHDTIEVGTFDNTLAASLGLPMDRHLGRPMPDAHRLSPTRYARRPFGIRVRHYADLSRVLARWRNEFGDRICRGPPAADRDRASRRRAPPPLLPVR